MASRFASLALASCLMLCQAPLAYAADPAPASTQKVVNDKPALATDACWDNTGVRRLSSRAAQRCLIA